MNLSVINPVVRWVVFAGIMTAAAALGGAGARHAVAQHWAGSSAPEQWLRAAQLEPTDAENWYRLGRYRQLDFEHADLPTAISYYRRATGLNPNSAEYWMDLAGAHENNRDSAKAEQAFHAALQDYPISGEVAWRFGNFLLRQGRTDEAFQEIRRAVSVEPQLISLAISRCWRGTGDINRILDLALPPNSDAYWGAIDFFVDAKEFDAATAVWERLVKNGATFPVSKAFPLLDMLIESGHGVEAEKIWQQVLKIGGVSSQAVPGGSLIWNGGFEGELLNGGFDWRYRPVDGVDVNLDVSNVHGGNRSLRLIFDDTANVNFEHVSQYVVVAPRTHYRFRAFVRSQDLTTDSGIRFQIEDASHPDSSSQFQRDPPQFTPNVVGTQPWTSNDAEFTTGAQTNLLSVTLRRVPSNRLANKISGTAWVDDISLTPSVATSAASR